MKRKFPDSIQWYLSGIKLKYKLLISYIILIIVPLGVFSLLTFNQYSNILQSHIAFSTNKSFDQTLSYLGVTLQKVKSISNIAVMNADVQQLFLYNTENGDIMDQLTLAFKVEVFLKSLKSKDIYDVCIYLPKESPYLYMNPTLSQADTLQTKDWWYNTLMTSASKLLWCPSNYLNSEDLSSGNIVNSINTLSLIRVVQNPRYLAENAGILRVDFKKDIIKDIVIRAVSTKGSLAYIQNSIGIPVAVSDLELYKKYAIPYTDISTSTHPQVKMPTKVINGKKMLYRIRQLEGTDWYLTMVIPCDVIFSEAKSIENKILLLFFSIANLAFLLACYLTKSITGRIYLLTGKMKDVQNGQLKSMINTTDRDEIGDLIRNFNYMLETISQLMEESYKAGLEIKNAELKTLQAQINPHFLYNTLDMINWLAQKNKVFEIEIAINSLSSFYKLGLSNGKDEIPIKDELELVSAYVRLQNMRFQNKLNLMIEVDEEIQKYKLLKLTLQPIVENSILHGIMKKLSKEGTIIIEGNVENGDVVLFVHDDGIGMLEEDVDLIGSKLESKHGGGYGVINIIRRIKIFYGEQYGLTYRSIYGQGTTAEIRIPVREDNI